jgi:hypothetical protein
MVQASSPGNPYSTRAPKPQIVALLQLLTRKQRDHYHKLARSLKILPGVHAELNFYGSEWGWALRYRRGDASLCTLHFLPSKLDATITVPHKLTEWALGPNHLSLTTKRDLKSLKNGTARMIRFSLGRQNRGRDLARMIRYKVTGQ